MKYAKRMLALALISLPILAVAQMAGSTRIVGQVPFPFMVGTKHVPAGQCTVERTGIGDGALVIRNLDAKVSLFTPATPNLAKQTSDHYALVFHMYGDRAFLTGIRLAGDRTIYQIPESKAEAELRFQKLTATEEMLHASVK